MVSSAIMFCEVY